MSFPTLFQHSQYHVFLFFVLKWNTESSLCCPNTHGVGIIHRNRVHLPLAMALKKTNSPSSGASTVIALPPSKLEYWLEAPQQLWDVEYSGPVVPRRHHPSSCLLFSNGPWTSGLQSTYSCNPATVLSSVEKIKHYWISLPQSINHETRWARFDGNCHMRHQENKQ